jgi:hypothetical protein
VVADANHIRRRLLHGEPGSVRLAASRMARSLLRPKAAEQDFETLLAIEQRHGFRSTFFLLHDKYWARQGSRYSLRCAEIHRIARRVLDAGGELGVHGGYYRFNQAALYRESLGALQAEFGVRPCGIRNHLLRFSYPETWRAQAQAGFAYDATYGLPQELGPRGGWPFPFQTCDADTGSLLDLIELPLTVMDATLFRYLRLGGERALEQAWQVIESVVQAGGLVSLLWHNNYFNEPEYADWQWVYERLLEKLARLHPWCATGAEINTWWRARSGLAISQPWGDRADNRWQIRARQPIANFAVDVSTEKAVRVHGAPNLQRELAGGRRIHFESLPAGHTACIEIAA